MDDGEAQVRRPSRTAAEVVQELDPLAWLSGRSREVDDVDMLLMVDGKPFILLKNCNLVPK